MKNYIKVLLGLIVAYGYNVNICNSMEELDHDIDIDYIEPEENNEKLEKGEVKQYSLPRSKALTKNQAKELSEQFNKKSNNKLLMDKLSESDSAKEQLKRILGRIIWIHKEFVGYINTFIECLYKNHYDILKNQLQKLNEIFEKLQNIYNEYDNKTIEEKVDIIENYNTCANETYSLLETLANIHNDISDLQHILKSFYLDNKLTHDYFYYLFEKIDNTDDF